MNLLLQLLLSIAMSTLQLSFFIVLAMLCVFVTGSYLVNSYPPPVSAYREFRTGEATVATKITPPRISPKLKYNQTIEDVARTYGLDSALLYAVISVESSYDAKALSKKGASGLMQLTPNIAKYYGVEDRLDPVQNIQGGAQYLRDMLILFNNDVSLAIAAYNAGETAVVRYGNRIPPYHETMNYVPRVLSLYQEYLENPPRPPNTIIVKG
jgi:soluble lytic murein transglycosylase-like protein